MFQRTVLCSAVVVSLISLGMLASLGQATPQDLGQGGWQYATLTVSARQGLAASWIAGDARLLANGGSALSSINTQLGGRGAVRNVYELLDQIGANGWELVEVNRESTPPANVDTPFSGIWTFKR